MMVMVIIYKAVTAIGSNLPTFFSHQSTHGSSNHHELLKIENEISKQTLSIFFCWEFSGNISHLLKDSKFNLREGGIFF